MLCFPGGDVDLLESLQLALGPGGLRGGSGDVELRNFSAFRAAGVGDIECDLNAFWIDGAGNRQRWCLEMRKAEGCVAESEAEGKQRVLAGGGPVAIADHQLVVVLEMRDIVVDGGMIVLGNVQFRVRA